MRLTHFLLAHFLLTAAKQQRRTYTRRNRQEYQSVPVPRGDPFYAEPQRFTNEPFPMFYFPWQTRAMAQFKQDHPEGDWDAEEEVFASGSGYDFESWAKNSPLVVNGTEGRGVLPTPVVKHLRPFVDPELLNDYVEWPSAGCPSCVLG